MGIARRESLSSGCSTFSLGFLCATGNSCNSGKAFRPLFWILRAPHTDCPHSTISKSPSGRLRVRCLLETRRAGRGGTEQPPGRRRNPRGSAGTGTERVRTPYGLPTGYRRGRSPSSPVPSTSDVLTLDFFRLVFDTRGSRTATLSCSYYVYVYHYHGDRRRADVRRDAPPPPRRAAPPALVARATGRSPSCRGRGWDGTRGGARGPPRGRAEGVSQDPAGCGGRSGHAGARDGGVAEDAPLRRRFVPLPALIPHAQTATVEYRRPCARCRGAGPRGRVFGLTSR